MKPWMQITAAVITSILVGGLGYAAAIGPRLATIETKVEAQDHANKQLLEEIRIVQGDVKKLLERGNGNH